jgi:pectate lyase
MNTARWWTGVVCTAALLGCSGSSDEVASGDPINPPANGAGAGGSSAMPTTPAAGTGGSSGSSGGGGSGGGSSTGGAGAGGTSAGGTSSDAGTSAGGDAAAGAGGGADPSECGEPWPEPTSTQPLDEPMTVDSSFDGELKRFVGPDGSGGQDENQDPLFILEDGATLENVVLGAPAGDGVHCLGSCTLRNVWWEDVGEDAATLKGDDPQQVMTIECGGAKLAEDKVFQHNGPGKMVIRNFDVEDFGKLYRSCGNCSTMHERHVEFEAVVARSGHALAGINVNYGDSATFTNITVYGEPDDVDICQRYEGNDDGDEPTLLGSGPDGEHCLYDESDVTWL